jgi:membrane protease YdiL (CAAX protease family)
MSSTGSTRSRAAASPGAAGATDPAPQPSAAHRSPTEVSFAARHPVALFLLAACAIFWSSWLPVLFLGAPPRLFSALGAVLGLALPAFLVTAAADGRAGVRDLVRRTLRFRLGIGWYLLAALAVPLSAMLLTPLLLGAAPLAGLLHRWPLLFTAYLPQLLVALVTVQLAEELGWAGFMQHRLQALKAKLLVALAFAFLHLPTYLHAPLTFAGAARDLTALVVVVPFAVVFRILIAYAYNRTASCVLVAAVTHASFNEASELVAPNVPGPLAEVVTLAAVALLALLVLVLTRGALALPLASAAGADLGR